MFSQILKLQIVYLLMSFSILQELVLCMKDSSTNILTTQIGLQNVVIYIQISDELIITKVLIAKAASPNVLKKNVIRIFTNI